VVTVRTDAPVASDALATLAAATDAAGLTPAGRPVRLEVVDRLPVLASGKPDRRALEARMRGGRDG
jgi:O-succinylbenzoic acid--CoA ligase